MVSAIDHISSRRIRRLKRDEYDRLVEAGCFRDEKIELLYGRLVEMSPQGHGHAYAIMRLNEALMPALVGRAYVRVQLPIGATDESEPEPDLAVVPKQDYDAHPTHAQLVIEVAESSLADDRNIKRSLYAQMGVPEMWIVNLVDDCVEVGRNVDPIIKAYGRVTRYNRGDIIELLEYPDVRIAVSDVLPKP